MVGPRDPSRASRSVPEIPPRAGRRVHVPNSLTSCPEARVGCKQPREVTSAIGESAAGLCGLSAILASGAPLFGASLLSPARAAPHRSRCNNRRGGQCLWADLGDAIPHQRRFNHLEEVAPTSPPADTPPYARPARRAPHRHPPAPRAVRPAGHGASRRPGRLHAPGAARTGPVSAFRRLLYVEPKRPWIQRTQRTFFGPPGAGPSWYTPWALRERVQRTQGRFTFLA